MNDLLIHTNRFLLVLLRTSGVVMVAPLFGAPAIPMMIKASFAVTVAVVLTPVVGGDVPALDNVLAFGINATRELGVGIVMGLSAMMTFGAFELTGELIGKQMGMAMAEELDPMFEHSSNTLSSFHNIIAMLLFVSINGHHWFLQALNASFNSIPLGGMTFSGPMAEGLLTRFAELFTAGLKMAAPGLCVLLLLTVGLAMLARAAPMLNMLMISVSLRIAAGLVLIGTLMPYIYTFGVHLMHNMRNDLSLLIRAM